MVYSETSKSNASTCQIDVSFDRNMSKAQTIDTPKSENEVVARDDRGYVPVTKPLHHLERCVITSSERVTTFIFSLMLIADDNYAVLRRDVTAGKETRLTRVLSSTLAHSTLSSAFPYLRDHPHRCYWRP